MTNKYYYKRTTHDEYGLYLFEREQQDQIWKRKYNSAVGCTLGPCVFPDSGYYNVLELWVEHQSYAAENDYRAPTLEEVQEALDALARLGVVHKTYLSCPKSVPPKEAKKQVLRCG